MGGQGRNRSLTHVSLSSRREMRQVARIVPMFSWRIRMQQRFHLQMRNSAQLLAMRGPSTDGRPVTADCGSWTVSHSN